MTFASWLASFFRQGPVVTFKNIPAGIVGTRIVISQMRAFVRLGMRDERLHQLARELVKGVAPMDARGEAQALFDYLRPGGSGGFRLTSLPWAPDGMQRLADPSYTALDAPERTAECASFTALYTTLAAILGHPVAFRTAGRIRAEPDNMAHVYSLDSIDGTWISVDPCFPYGLDYPNRAPLSSAEAIDAAKVAVTMDWTLG